MNDNLRPFLDFYKKHRIIPTNLNIGDKTEFFAQRDRLFLSLGVPPILLRNKNIFELGPGTGIKALHLLSKQPISYLAVDNNPMSLEATQEAIKSSKFSGDAEIYDKDFLAYESSRRFDLVIAELVLSTQHNPEKFLTKLLEITIDQGILVITCCDPISILSESLRKLITIKEKLTNGDIENSAIRIADFFKQDLDHLVGMNRIRTDWAIDQMIHPWIGPLLTIPVAIEFLASTAEFHGSSPRFVDDFSWYKDPNYSVNAKNNNAIQNYWEKCHSFLDLRLPRSIRDVNLNKSLYQTCNELYSEAYTNIWNNDSHSRVLEICHNLRSCHGDLGESVNKSLDSFIEFWRSGKIASLQEFRPLWGRGSQYISFTKISSAETMN
jgi:predicted RNA methylase